MKRRRRTAWALLLVFSLLCSVFPAGTAAGAGVVRWPKNAEIISEEMFYGNDELEQVIIPEGVREIRSKAFANSSLREITLPDSLEFIADDAFDGCDLETMIIHAKKGTNGYNWMRDRGYLAEYRALLIGEKTFYRDSREERIAQRNVNDVNNMKAMLQQKVYGPDPSGRRYDVEDYRDLSKDKIRVQIEDTFDGAMEQDVSLFFIATHGLRVRDGDLEMPFLLSQRFLDLSTLPEEGDPNYEDYMKFKQDVQDFNANGRFLSFDTLASWLSEVPGKVIVILESCGAGAAIYDGISENSVSTMLYAGKNSSASADGDDTFAERAVQAFAKADPGISAGPQTFEKRGAGTGALREPKFYVLAASRHNEDSYGTGGNNGTNYFTDWLIRGVGRAGASPADKSPKDGYLTLRELFQYINGYSSTGIGGGYEQHVQCYPQNSEFECFYLK